MGTDQTEYRILEEGEIIQEGDEVEVSEKWNDEFRWVPAKQIGKPAPNPHYPAHRVYRRRVTTDTEDTDRTLREAGFDPDLVAERYRKLANALLTKVEEERRAQDGAKKETTQ